MSAHLSIRVDLADEPTVRMSRFTGPSLQVARTVRVEDTLEHIGTTVLLEAESLDALYDWLCAAALQVDDEFPRQRGEPDTDAAAADAGALA